MKRFFGSMCVGIILVPGLLFGAKTSNIQADKPAEQKITNLKGTKTGTSEMNYQGWLGDASDTLAVEGKFNMIFRIYNSPSGGSLLWSEQDSVEVSKGIFNVLLGSVTPMPDSLFINNDILYLETEVNSEILLPRKKIVSVGYAVRSKNSGNADTAEIAKSLQGMDTTGLNSKYVKKTGDLMSGALTTLATSSADLVSATQSGIGGAGYFEINNGSNVKPAVYGSTTGSGDAVEGYTTGTGRAGYFQISNVSNSNPAVLATTNGSGNAIRATTTTPASAIYGASNGVGAPITGIANGTGNAGYFQINNASNSNSALYGTTNGSGEAVYGYTNGTGNAGSFQVTNASSSSHAIQAVTNGSGNGVYGYNNGTGRAGYFQIQNGSNSSSAIEGTTNGSGNAVYGYASGNGTGLYGYSTGAGAGVVGYTSGSANAGFFQISNASSGNCAVYGTTNGSGNGVRGYMTGTGDAVCGINTGTSGRSGMFQTSNVSNTFPSLYGVTNGSGSATMGSTTGSGNAIEGYTAGTGSAGYFQMSNGSNSADVIHLKSNGSGNYIGIEENSARLTKSGVWTDASSREYKENINELETGNAVKALNELKPVTFNYKVDKSDNYCGFIAEDVPELVAMKDRKSLSAMDIVAVLTKVVQEQQKEINALKKEMKEIKGK